MGILTYEICCTNYVIKVFLSIVQFCQNQHCFITFSYVYFEVIFYFILLCTLKITYITNTWISKDSFDCFKIIKFIYFIITCTRVENMKNDFPVGIFLKCVIMINTVFSKYYKRNGCCECLLYLGLWLPFFLSSMFFKNKNFLFVIFYKLWEFLASKYYLFIICYYYINVYVFLTFCKCLKTFLKIKTNIQNIVTFDMQ